MAATGNGNALSFLSQYVNKNKSGNEIDEEYAKAITNLVQNGMSKDEKETAIESRLVPSNCPRLDLVRVNSEIFNRARKEIKTEDVMLQRVQKPLLTGLTELTGLMNKFIAAEKGEGKALQTPKQWRLYYKQLLSSQTAHMN